MKIGRGAPRPGHDGAPPQPPRPGAETGAAGVNLLRAVIASYFIATALGLVAGPHPAPVFEPLLGDRAGPFASIAMFLMAFALLCGVALRLMALTLSSLVFAASWHGAFGGAGAGLDALWRDMTLIAALMLTYVTLDRDERREAALIRRRAVRRVVRRPRPEGAALPRRVPPQEGTARTARLAPAESGPTGRPRQRVVFEGEPGAGVDNIFADLAEGGR